MRKSAATNPNITRACLTLPVACLTLAISACSWTEMISVNSAGEQHDVFDWFSSSFVPTVSANGRYVAFSAVSTNLVANDVGGYEDVFVRDSRTGKVTRISVDGAGIEGNGDSSRPYISGDGRFVAYESEANNLVPGDTNNAVDIFLHDRETGTTTRISVHSDGAQADGYSRGASLSGDGRYTAFWSAATNLVDDDTNAAWDAFVYDRVIGHTTRLSVNADGVEGNGNSFATSLSADGRYAVIESEATNFLDADTNNERDVFVVDRDTGTMTPVSVSSDGIQADGLSYHGWISGDGRHVAYNSDADNLVSGDTNGTMDIFVHELETGTTERVSVDSAGNEANWYSYVPQPSISHNGRFVLFLSGASNLVTDDTNEERDIFLHDRNAGTTTRVSVGMFGEQGTDSSDVGVLSSDGRYAVFRSQANNLVENDDYWSMDLFIRALPQPTIASVVPNHLPIGQSTAVTISGSYFLSGAKPSGWPVLYTNVVILDENTMTADAYVPPFASQSAMDIVVVLPGTGPGALRGAMGICTDCLTLQ